MKRCSFTTFVMAVFVALLTAQVALAESTAAQGKAEGAGHTWQLFSVDPQGVYLFLDDEAYRLDHGPQSILLPVMVVSPSADKVLVRSDLANGVVVGEGKREEVAWPLLSSPLFSPGGVLVWAGAKYDPVAYPGFDGDELVGYFGRREGTWRLVLRGVEQPGTWRVPGGLIATKGHVAYAEPVGSGWRVVTDGQSGPTYDAVAGLSFRVGEALPTYGARQGSTWRLVHRGQIGPENFPEIAGTASLQGDGAAVVLKQGKGFVCQILGGKPSSSYDAIGPLAPSPDGKRVAFAGRRGDKWRIVVISQQGPVWDSIEYSRVGAGPFCEPGSRELQFGGGRYVSSPRPPYDKVIPEDSWVHHPKTWSGDGGLTGGGGPAWIDNRHVSYVAWKDYRVYGVQGEVR